MALTQLVRRLSARTRIRAFVAAVLGYSSHRWSDALRLEWLWGSADRSVALNRVVPLALAALQLAVAVPPSAATDGAAPYSFMESATGATLVGGLLIDDAVRYAPLSRPSSPRRLFFSRALAHRVSPSPSVSSQTQRTIGASLSVASRWVGGFLMWRWLQPSQPSLPGRSLRRAIDAAATKRQTLDSNAEAAWAEGLAAAAVARTAAEGAAAAAAPLSIGNLPTAPTATAMIAAAPLAEVVEGAEVETETEAGVEEAEPMGVVTTLDVAKATVGHVVATPTKKKKKKLKVAVERAAGGGGRMLGSVHALAHEMETARPDDGRYHHSTVHSDSLHDAADEAAAGDEASGVLVEGELEHKTLVMQRFKKKVLQLHSCGDFYVKGRSGGFLLYEPKSQVRALSLSLSLSLALLVVQKSTVLPPSLTHPPPSFPSLPFPSPQAGEDAALSVVCGADPEFIPIVPNMAPARSSNGRVVHSAMEAGQIGFSTVHAVFAFPVSSSNEYRAKWAAALVAAGYTGIDEGSFDESILR